LSVPAKLPFDEVKKIALSRLKSLVEGWCPGGIVRNKEYVALNPTRPDRKIKSFSVNIETGKWSDFATGDKGGDPLSLYAYLKCGGTDKAHRVEACKLLAAELGLSGEPTAPAPIKARPQLKVVPKDEPAEWQPIVPPPDDVPEPDFKDYDHVFVYRDRAGRLLRYVVRRDADKYIRPLTYGIFKGAPCWKLLGPNNPKSLYGLERLDGRPVLLQEGEKKTDQVAALLPDYACLSLTGGAAAYNHNDLTPLGGMIVVYCPDNDEPGRKAAQIVTDKLTALGCTVLVVDVSSNGFPEKWDLGNAVTGDMPDGGKVEPWDADRIRAFVKGARPFIPETGDVDQGEPDDDAEWRDAPDQTAKAPIALGYDNGVYYYLSPRTKQIEPLARRSHTKNDLIGIARLEYYRSLPFEGPKGGLDWDAIADFLKEACAEAGFYNPDRVRGRGAWLEDDGRAVLHLGDRLLVGGDSLPLMLPGSRYVYEGARSLNYVQADPLDAARAAELLEICNLFRWEKKISGTLMAGWLVVAPICGALFWRPTIWITGGSGSGKSTLEKLVMKPALGGIGLFLKSGTTEAGIRQKLNRDARPVMVDEAEAESLKAKTVIQGLFELVRQSSSEGGAEIIKGTQSQTGAKTYHVRSCFAFSSINPTLDHLADESRVSVLELKNPKGQKVEEFDALVARVTGTMTPEFCAGLIARSVALMPTILKNAATFSKAVAVHLGSSRVGDQIGTLLAGAYALQKNGEVSFETALEWVKKQDWEDTTSADADPDERRMLNHLMQQRVRLDHGGGKYQDVTLAELIGIAAKDHTDVSGMAQAELKRHGLWYDDGGVWIANDHTALKKHLEGTPWSSSWDRTLRRLPGTRARERTEAAIRFAGGRSRATFVPMDLID
jgi:putative DNA primase/helicase